MSNVYDKLKEYAKNHLNVMLIGNSGVGKTACTKAIAEEMGLSFAYFSAPTLDPWTGFVGIPKPVDDEDGRRLEMYRPKIVDDAEFLFFDELNRSHHKTRDAVMEIVQFKTINGEPLPKLKMVWAAINPPGDDYQVDELDPALVDRFHVFVQMKAHVSLPYLSKVMKPETAKILAAWWDQDLDDNQRKVVTPRRIEYMGKMIDKGIPWMDALPQGKPLPHPLLMQRLSHTAEGDSFMNVTMENILSNLEKFVVKIQVEPSMAIKVAEALSKIDTKDTFKARDLLEILPKDIVSSILKPRFRNFKQMVYDEFVENNVDYVQYPKLAEICDFDAIKKKKEKK